MLVTLVSIYHVQTLLLEYPCTIIVYTCLITKPLLGTVQMWQRLAYQSVHITMVINLKF